MHGQSQIRYISSRPITSCHHKDTGTC